MKRRFLLPLIGLLLSGYGSPAIAAAEAQAGLPALQTAYDRILFDSRSRSPIRLEELIDGLRGADVVFIGEFHGNHASHLLQSQIQNRLFQHNPKQILSMEQFERHQQEMLNRYLDSAVGEAYLINEAPAWKNYTASYRPLVEFSKRHFLPVIAANAPADLVRCIGRQGDAYLAKLTPIERRQLAAKPFAEIPHYREKFERWFEGARHGSTQRRKNSYLAQLVRDNTMAESILQALKRHPGHQLIHLNGTFHSEQRLGTVAALQRMAPELKIKVISPIHASAPAHPRIDAEDFKKGDYVYLLQSQPEQYRQAEYRKNKFQKMFQTADKKPCR